MLRSTLALGLAVLCLVASRTGAQDLASLLPAESDLAPLALAGSVERHDPDSLWEKINGEAELYRRFGLSEAAFAYYEDPADPARGIEASLYRVDRPLGAFGLFAAHRQPAAVAASLGNDGQVDGYQVLTWHGDLFIVLHGFGTEQQRRQDLTAASRALARTLGPPPSRPALLVAFEALVRPDSVRYHPDHLLQRETLPPGLTGDHPSGVAVFCSTGPLPADWTEDRLGLSGRKLADRESVRGVTGQDPFLGPLTLWWSEGRVLGLRAAPDAPGAATAGRELLHRLLP